MGFLSAFVILAFMHFHIVTDALIGVHCTHGVNRTGYLICRYLIQKLKWDPEEAIQKFAEYRGHPIERPNYLESLKNLPKNESMEEEQCKHIFHYSKFRDLLTKSDHFKIVGFMKQAKSH